MAFTPKLNTCGLFKNERNDRSDFTGQITIECPRCHASSGWWVNGWRKVSQGGVKYLYLALKPKEPKSENATATRQPTIVRTSDFVRTRVEK
jgi:hypothetical protein